MLAQAQACFYEKAVRDRKAGGSMKPAILTKLAFEAAALFSTALSFSRFGTMASALDPSWPAIISYQVETFSAAAEYWASMVAKEAAIQKATGYGVEIARLALGERRALQAIALCRQQPSLATLVDSATALLTAVRHLKASAESDNSKIYLEQVPNPDTLPALTGAKMVKMIDFPEYYNTEKALFKDFTPSDVRAMVDSYRSQADAMYRQQEEAVTLASNNARSTLSAQGLPSSLEMYKSGGKLPENLWLKIEQIQRLGGVAEVQRKLSEVMASAASANTTFENITNTIQRENRSDDLFRTKHTQYTSNVVPYSDQLFSNEIKEPLENLRKACKSASDTNTETQIEMNNESFDTQCKVLSMSKSDLSDYLNSNGTEGGANFLEAVTVSTGGLESALVSLAALLEQRDQALLSLRTDIDNTLTNADDQFMQRRSAEAGESKDNAVAFFVGKLTPAVDSVRSLIQKQDETLAQVKCLLRCCVRVLFKIKYYLILILVYLLFVLFVSSF
jgi:programmed cell death 6-interacting protein